MGRENVLGRYQKLILLLLALMVLIFAVLYAVTVSRKGFAYKDVILVPNQENGSTTYSGEIQGKQAVFTVSADKTVQLQYDGKVYGPYTAKADPTALPKDGNAAAGMTGIEIRCGNEIFFRGGVRKTENFWWLVNEDGTSANISIQASTSNGTVLDANGNVVDLMEPSVSAILNLMTDPEMTHKGEWAVWFLGVLCCAVTAISIVFADALFRLSLAFKVQDVDSVEPSEWEISGRYISWTAALVVALIVFIKGLQ